MTSTIGGVLISSLSEVNELLARMASIEAEIKKVRNDPSLANDQKTDRIIVLFEHRNEAYEALQAIRGEQLRTFVDELGLEPLGIVPYFTTQQKCTLQLKDNTIASLIRPQSTNNTPWEKLVHKFSGNNQQKRSHVETEYHNHLKERRTRILGEITQNQTPRSPDDAAALKSLQAELTLIESTLGV